MSQIETDEKWMAYAIALAEKAQAEGEVPVGAVLVQNDTILGEGWNQPISGNDPTAHAEIQAIRHACKNAENYRLPGTTLYITLEPCIMCAGAIVHSRIARLVFAAPEPKTGAAGSYINIFELKNLNHRVEVEQGVLNEQTSEMLKQFFRLRRKKLIVD
jgi:tRNA(adenine34) deaminase